MSKGTKETATRGCAAPLLFAGATVMSLTTVVSVGGAHLLASPQNTSAAVPLPANPITAILDAFRTHHIVTLSDPHGNLQVQAFVLSLIRDGRFPLAASDIVIETALSDGKKVRIIAGDPPIDWDNITSPQDHRHWIELRDSYPADTIRRQVLDRDRRALVIYGRGHLQRRQIASNYDTSTWQSQTVVSLLEYKEMEPFFVAGDSDAP
jgi:hypothetical protein